MVEVLGKLNAGPGMRVGEKVSGCQDPFSGCFAWPVTMLPVKEYRVLTPFLFVALPKPAGSSVE